jgi:hypothetical protein
MHQLKTAPHGLGMDGVDVDDLDGDLRDDGRRRILAQNAELGGRARPTHARARPPPIGQRHGGSVG